MDKIIRYFVKRHFLTNFLVLAVLLGGVFAWQNTKKEELPDVTFDFARISVRYPGASAEDVEYFVTKPLEEVLRGIDGIYQITSNSSEGSCSISVEIEKNVSNIDEVINDIRNEILDVNLPDEILDDLNFRVFKTSKKAIIDIAIINTEKDFLNTEDREKLQEYVLALENQLLNLAQVNSVNRRDYLQKELQITVDPKKLIEYEIPFNNLTQEIRNNNIRKPSGHIETLKEPKVTLLSELNTPKKLNNLIVQGGFEGGVIRLKDVADIKKGFRKSKRIVKINGKQGIILNIVKNSSYGILDSIDAVRDTVEKFRKNNLTGSSIQAIFLDDESIDLRNRLSLISINGIIGFILILAVLFIFLNKRSGFWVAMGIPFTLSFSMLVVYVMGYTINGITLAGVIIVMGMIVDDAIVVSENITRMMYQGVSREDAAVKGTSYVFLPVVASVITTCIAFIPMYFFGGRFGEFIRYIPAMIFIMLGASLVESLVILPGHMALDFSFLNGFIKKGKSIKQQNKHWFEKVEMKYGELLKKVLPYKFIIFIGFIVLFLLSLFIVKQNMQFVMFPDEETRQITLNGNAPKGTKRFETARLTKQIEDKLYSYVGNEVIGYRTTIAQSRHGSSVEENKFRISIEIVPKEKRDKSADELIAEIELKLTDLKGIEDVKFRKSRFGHASGSPIELLVQQNNNELRDKILKELVSEMEKDPNLKNAEIDEAFRIPEYRVSINQEKIKRLSISPVDIASTLRASLEGVVLFDFSDGDEDVDVRLSILDEAKDSIEDVLKIPVENRGNYLVPLGDIVYVEKIESPSTIYRQDMKRTSIIYADLNEEVDVTPLEIGKYYEENIFNKIYSKYPTTTLSFGGEIKDTRESKNDMFVAVIMAIFLIYMVLAILFSSLIRPVIIMLAIPMGIIGIVFAFWLHGKTMFGFFSAIGAIGLAGVVINDSIIMLVKLDKEYDDNGKKKESNIQIADIAKTRLRAVLLTTITTIAGLLPTAYGIAGYDAMLAEMMFALSWGLMFGTLITLVLMPSVYSLEKDVEYFFKGLGWKR